MPSISDRYKFWSVFFQILPWLYVPIFSFKNGILFNIVSWLPFPIFQMVSFCLWALTFPAICEWADRHFALREAFEKHPLFVHWCNCLKGGGQRGAWRSLSASSQPYFPLSPPCSPKSSLPTHPLSFFSLPYKLGKVIPPTVWRFLSIALREKLLRSSEKGCAERRWEGPHT